MKIIPSPSFLLVVPNRNQIESYLPIVLLKLPHICKLVGQPRQSTLLPLSIECLSISLEIPLVVFPSHQQYQFRDFQPQILRSFQSK